MTALTTIIALIPLALGLGSSGAIMQPLAIVSIGGLLYATAMSLLMVPAFYTIACWKKDREEQREQNRNRKLENELHAGANA
jgi:Cu/Ag efflux pump CusA